jgi:hypothetical protein
MAISCYSADGGSHSVQVYSDISGEWVSGTTTLPVNWTTVTQDAVTHEIHLQNQTRYAEDNDRILRELKTLYGIAFSLLTYIAEGSVFYSTLNVSSAIAIMGPTEIFSL